MEFISNALELKKSFRNLITQYSQCCICVAWASQESEVMELLDKYHSKVKKMIVGLDLRQTDYRFIEQNLTRKAVRYYTAKHDGVFHPKMYLFYDDEKHWRAIVGSANLTYNGFSVNQEVCVVVGDNDKDSKSVFHSMLDFIDRQWELSSKLTAEDMAVYKANYRKQVNATKSAVLGFKPWALKQAIIDNMTWDEYLQNLKKEGMKVVKNRLKLLERAHNMFASVDSFNSLPYPDRACIAGYRRSFYINPDKIDCYSFGSTRRATDFTHSIKNEEKLSEAIDVIPLKEKVTKAMYEEYCSYFEGNPIGCATRLLAIKRPDFFVCINKKNKKGLCNDFGISESKLNLNNYWDLIICRIQDSNWYNDHRALKGDDKEIKKNQVAMLDSIYYRY